METNDTATRLSARTEQARREVGHTEVARPVAWLLVALAGFAVLVPPLVQSAIDLAAGKGPFPALSPPGELLVDFVSSNTAVVEERLEEESWLRDRLLPPTQRFLTGSLGLGNERALAGDDGWWYLADDFRHVTGRGFLEPAEIERRFRDEDVAADPVPKLVAVARALERRGVELVVLPVPAKPSVVAEPLGGSVPPVHNASFGAFLERLETNGVEVYDPTADLLELEREGVSSFLRTDTHWSPAAVDRVASALAGRLREIGVEGRPGDLYRRRIRLSGRGDLTAMLRLPPESARPATETVEADLVLTAEGDPWRPDPNGQVLLLGDSFSNVFSDPNLGWGNGAGLAEQLAFHLGAGVDRIAENAGGASGSLATLVEKGLAGDEPLAGRKVVIWEFAARELSTDGWTVSGPLAGGDL